MTLGAGQVPQAVLFDMDGTLIDSERLWYETETEVMERLGGEWTPDDQAKLIGGNLAVASDYMVRRAGTDVPAEQVGRWLMAGMLDRMRTNVPMLPGAKELLVGVRAAGFPTALVTSTHRALLEPALDGIGRDHFDLTLAGDEVSRTKPDPEPYLTACARLGADPARCVVLEDSPNGLASAEAAGCRTVAVPGFVVIGDAPGRTRVASLAEVDVPFLRSLFA
ncbi:HAD family hydrolase [Actinomadura rupiterrae]|uniref:HAD family hydrolase n=1 Tax=Actinomadura rupiterrae TaxID=559627 RepID=UPI0027E2CBDF|nr:HAD family phosphatase [Actinomadura rupiterrae]MCP2342631.1 HAD superfamily hydrolase (TIGR01509 family) [Actinomadura rupiterrae]